MSALQISTFVALGALVVVLATTLITIALLLVRIRHTAGLIVFGLRAIAHRTKPVNEVVTGVNQDLIAVRDALTS